MNPKPGKRRMEKPATSCGYGLYGGGGEIRTPVPVRANGFQDLRADVIRCELM